MESKKLMVASSRVSNTFYYPNLILIRGDKAGRAMWVSQRPLIKNARRASLLACKKKVCVLTWVGLDSDNLDWKNILMF